MIEVRETERELFRRYDSGWQQGGYDLPDRLSYS
jgi:hypothetical protein